MKLKSDSKHKFDTSIFAPNRAMQGKLNTDELAKLGGGIISPAQLAQAMINTAMPQGKK